jgi:hypothetical protein
MPYSDASTYHILWSDVVIVESAAVERAVETTDSDAVASAEA